MKRLILTNNSSAAGLLRMADVADALIAFERRLIWGQLFSDAEPVTFFEAPIEQQPPISDQDYPPQFSLHRSRAPNLGLTELCGRFDTIELWIDPRPNDQLQLACLLHYLRPHRDIASKLALCQSDTEIGSHMPEEPPHWRPSAVKVGNNHFELGSRAWRAFAAPTPQDWFGLLAENLSVLPKLKRAVVRLLEELPWRATGLGVTEMRMLRLISKGNMSADGVFRALHKPNTRRVFDYWGLGWYSTGLRDVRRQRCQA
jgi:hypothetical protein